MSVTWEKDIPVVPVEKISVKDYVENPEACQDTLEYMLDMAIDKAYAELGFMAKIALHIQTYSIFYIGGSFVLGVLLGKILF